MGPRLREGDVIGFRESTPAESFPRRRESTFLGVLEADACEQCCDTCRSKSSPQPCFGSLRLERQEPKQANPNSRSALPIARSASMIFTTGAAPRLTRQAPSSSRSQLARVDASCKSPPEFPDLVQQYNRLSETDPDSQQTLAHASDSYCDARLRAVFAMAPALGPASQLQVLTRFQFRSRSWLALTIKTFRLHPAPSISPLTFREPNSSSFREVWDTMFSWIPARIKLASP